METLGRRLKEERERLRLSQTDFAALAGQKKQSQIRYEADERSPDSDYLAALAANGVDALFVLTGTRQSTPNDLRPSSFPAGGLEPWNENDQVDELERQIEQVRVIAKDEQGEQLDDIRAQLREIAMAQDYPDSVRARADNLLRDIFGDKEAGVRRGNRYALIADRARQAKAELDDALQGLNWSVAAELHHRLQMMMTGYKITPEDLMALLVEMKALEQKAEGRSR